MGSSAPQVQTANAFALRARRLSATAPTNGQALVYDSASGLWVPGASSGSGSVSLPHVDAATSTGPGATAAWENLGAAYTAPANTWTQVGDTLRLSYYVERASGGAGLSDGRVLVAGVTSGDFTSFNRTAGDQGSLVLMLLLIRTAADALTVIGYGTENGSTGPSSFVSNTQVGIGGLTFSGTIAIQPQCKDSTVTGGHTRRMLMIEKLLKT